MAARHPPCRALKPKEKDYKVTDRDGMYVHVTAKGAMSFRMDCQPMSWLRSTMQPSRPSRNGHPISTAFRFRSDNRVAVGTSAYGAKRTVAEKLRCRPLN